MTGIAEAYYETVSAIAAGIAERPLPDGINVRDTEDWHLAVNVGSEQRDHEGTPLRPYEALARHKQYLVLAMFGPDGGMIGGGMPEGEYIEQMRALASVDRSPKGEDPSGASSRSDESAVGEAETPERNPQ